MMNATFHACGVPAPGASRRNVTHDNSGANYTHGVPHTKKKGKKTLAKKLKRLRRRKRDCAKRKLERRDANCVGQDSGDINIAPQTHHNANLTSNCSIPTPQSQTIETNKQINTKSTCMKMSAQDSRTVTFKLPYDSGDQQNEKLSANTVMNSSSEQLPSSSTYVPPVGRSVLQSHTVTAMLPSGESALQSRSIPGPEQYVALDCEMVGVGVQKSSALARCSVVDYHGHVILDLYVKPDQPITDYRTPWSGIRPRDMMRAIPFKNARNMIIKAVQMKIVVGHAIVNDFKALRYFHPGHIVRDTSKYRALREMANFNPDVPASLKRLTRVLCGYSIQNRKHCSVEDSRATMSLFKLVRLDWEKILLAKPTIPQPITDEERIRRISNSRSISESSDECYLTDNYWPQDEKNSWMNVH